MAMMDSDDLVKEVEQEKRDKAARQSAVMEFGEFSDDMDLKRAVWFYNLHPERRDQITRIYFSRFSTVQEWMDVYRLSGEGEEPSKKLAIREISKMELAPEHWIDFYEAEAKEEKLKEVALLRLEAYGEKDFERWVEIYDLAPMDTPIKSEALKKIILYAKSREDWQKIYDRSDIGSPLQVKALQNMLLLARAAIREEREESESHMRYIHEKAPYIWRHEYEELEFRYDLFSQTKDTALMNMYLSADGVAGEQGKETAEEETQEKKAG